LNHNTFIRRHLLKPRSIPFPHRLCAQWGKLPCGAEPNIELRPALQQANALPTEPRRTITEPRRTILSHAAPSEPRCTITEPRRTILSHAVP
jgi:hypothetical protein